MRRPVRIDVVVVIDVVGLLLLALAAPERIGRSSGARGGCVVRRRGAAVFLPFARVRCASAVAFGRSAAV
jgi:hypothetical protein